MATINPEILKSQGIRFVRIIWCDTGNVIRGKAIHIDTLAERLDIGVGAIYRPTGNSSHGRCGSPR